MAETDAKQIYTNALPLAAIVLMASGIVVKSVPLESRRPVDPERVAFVQAGRQDVEARLWQDPFTAIRGIKGETETAAKRCTAAKGDSEHWRLALHKSIAARTGNGHSISVLAVMIPGGPYFEDGEARRRSRYAVVSALLHTHWEPASEDKLGYVWTLESCSETASQRRAPELLPYEWFRSEAIQEDAAGEASVLRRDLLVLWVNEDSIERRPLRGMERIVELLADPCPSVPGSAKTAPDCPPRSGPGVKPALPLKANGCVWDTKEDPRKLSFEKGHGREKRHEIPLPWCETRVIGPLNSSSLQRLVHELALSSKSKSATPADWLRFYSSGATTYLDDLSFQSEINDAGLAKSASSDRPTSIEELYQLFTDRVVRLTATDDQLTDAFAKELRLRLADPTPFSRIRDFVQNTDPFCASTIVLVHEGDTSYARDFERHFAPGSFSGCPKENLLRVVPVRYLRGLDGVLPGANAAPVAAVAGQQARAPDARDTLLDPVTLERADGRSQYDYLRRLAQHLGEIDRQEKRVGRKGIRGIGLVGNDAYDKLLVLDALRDRFPKAVFFTADLDARLIGGKGVQSTRNLVVASAYGLTLNPGIQGESPPFRDTYQTGNYLATLVALDSRTAGLPQESFESWFDEPRLFEVGRTRAVPLSRGSDEICSEAIPTKCGNIQALDEWKDAAPIPRPIVLLALAAMVSAAAALTLLLSRAAREGVAGIRAWCSPRRVALVALSVLGLTACIVLAGWDVTSGRGEPFAWFEGVSIWPTQIFRLGILVLTIGLLAFGRRQLSLRIDKVAAEFGLTTLTKRTESPLPPVRGWSERLCWIWGAWTTDAGEAEGARPEDPQAPSRSDPWIEYLDRMRMVPSTWRIAVTSALFFVFSVALTSLDWPHSPHRGELSAWFNHGLLLLLIAAMTALLFAALDASSSATRLLARLRPGVAMEKQGGVLEKELRRQYPVGEQTIESWIRFRLAVRITSEVNWFIYLPFLTLLLIIPTQSRIFDAWDLPLTFAALMAISIGLAALCARGLRRAAEGLKREILGAIESELQDCKVAASGLGSQGAQPEPREGFLKQIAEHIRAVRDGPFLPLSQEPAVRAILLLLGGAGGISTAEFLFVSRG